MTTVNGAKQVEHSSAVLADETAALQERLEAAWLLGSAGGPEAVEALVRALGDQADSVRTASASALGRIRDPRAVPALIETLQDPHAHVRLSAVWALGEIGDPRTHEALVRMLEDANPTVRSASVQALGLLGDPHATAAIALRLTDSSRSVRLAAAQILERLGRAELLVPALDDPEWGIRLYAVDRLAQRSAEQVLDPLVRTLLRREEHSFVRARAASALAGLGDPRAIGPLRRAYADRAWFHRDAAQDALARLVGPRSRPLLDGFKRLAGILGRGRGPDRME